MGTQYLSTLRNNMGGYIICLLCFLIILAAVVVTEIYKNIYPACKRVSEFLLRCRDCLDEQHGYARGKD